jgi:hypothetical protein
MQQPTETVTRPDPGLARGKWEAPAWAFWVALAVILVGTTLYVLRRMGILVRKSSSSKASKIDSTTGARPKA